jgi:hypothetical protein
VSRIRIIHLANGRPSSADGMWVKSYTPDGFGGRGDLVLTENKHQAKVYPDAVAAMEDWKRVSSTHPTRPGDGKPNRPMTAFTIEVI